MERRCGYEAKERCEKKGRERGRDAREVKRTDEGRGRGLEEVEVVQLSKTK